MTPQFKHKLSEEFKSYFRVYGYEPTQVNIIDFKVDALIQEYKPEIVVNFLYEFLQEELKTINCLESYIIENILFVFSRIDAKYITEDIYGCLFSICKQKFNMAIVENCISCFEKWSTELSLKCLNELEIDIVWLNNYRLQVIEDIKQNLLENDRIQ